MQSPNLLKPDLKFELSDNSVQKSNLATRSLNKTFTLLRLARLLQSLDVRQSCLLLT